MPPKENETAQFVAFLRKQLDHRRTKLSEYLEAAETTKAQAEGLLEDIEKARSEGLPESFIAKLEDRLQKRVAENAEAVENFKRLRAQVQEDEEFLNAELGGGEEADGKNG